MYLNFIHWQLSLLKDVSFFVVLGKHYNDFLQLLIKIVFSLFQIIDVLNSCIKASALTFKLFTGFMRSFSKILGSLFQNWQGTLRSK